MTDGSNHFRSNVETKVAAEFGSERDAERVAAAVVRLCEAEDVDWNPSFVVEKMADAPKEHSVPEKWNWLLGYFGSYSEDFEAYELDAEL
jgi:hypothetical protein